MIPISAYLTLGGFALGTITGAYTCHTYNKAKLYEQQVQYEQEAAKLQQIGNDVLDSYISIQTKAVAQERSYQKKLRRALYTSNLDDCIIPPNITRLLNNNPNSGTSKGTP